MNIKEYMEAAATTERDNGAVIHRARIAAYDGAHFYARFTRKWQQMFLDYPRTRHNPAWLSRYDGTWKWEPMLEQWWRDHGGISPSMFSVDACNMPISEIMGAVTRYGHVMIAPKESTLPAYISCLDSKAGVVSQLEYGVLAEFKTLRDLRGWLNGNVSYVSKSTRPKLGKTLGEWLAGVCDTGITEVNMREQEVPMYLRNSDIEEIPGFPGWKYDTPDGNLRQNIGRAASLSDKKVDYNFDRQIDTMLSSRIGRRTVRLDVTRKLAWRRGDYGDERSCFWTSATRSRNMLQHAGAYAIRFYDTDGAGAGRCWALPRGDAVAIFNAYGRYQLHEIAAILEHATGHEARRIQYNYANIYINNNTVYGFNYQNALAQFNADLYEGAPRVYSEMAQCRGCSVVLNPTGAEDVPADRRCPSCHADFERRQREEEEARARREAERLAQQVEQVVLGQEYPVPVPDQPMHPYEDVVIENDVREQWQLIGGRLGVRAIREADYWQMCIDACHRAAVEHPGPWYGTWAMQTRKLPGADVYMTATRDFWNAWHEMPAGSLTDAFRILTSAEREIGVWMNNTVFRFERRAVEVVLTGQDPITLTQVWVLVNRAVMQ